MNPSNNDQKEEMEVQCIPHNKKTCGKFEWLTNILLKPIQGEDSCMQAKGIVVNAKKRNFHLHSTKKTLERYKMSQRANFYVSIFQIIGHPHFISRGFGGVAHPNAWEHLAL